MKKMIVAAAVAAMAAGGAVALRTIVSQSDPVFEANVEALTQAEIGNLHMHLWWVNVQGNGVICTYGGDDPCK